MSLPTPYYDRDGITIYNADNVDLMKEMDSESIDLVVTSPPYDDLRVYGGHTWDFEGVAQQLMRVTKPGGVVVWVVNDATVNGSETGTSFRQALRFMEIGFRLHDTMIYMKRNAIPLTHNRYEQQWEYMFVFSRGRPKTFTPLMENCKYAGTSQMGTFRHEGQETLPAHKQQPVKESRIRYNVWQFDVGNMKSSKDIFAFQHPATFPESLARDHILSWSNEGDIVLDPFNGSGTTVKMAREMGRRAVGIEINKDYCDIAVERLRQKLLPLGGEQCA
jgi:site-specific DNA-methyltransferase (adenine-specific)